MLITLAIEAFFAAILTFRFSAVMPMPQAIHYGIFHSISAFCNAGFDLFGNYKSLTAFVDDPTVNICIMLLIIMGGLGFTVMVDLWKAPSFRRLTLHSKLVLVMTGALLLLGAIGYFILEYSNAATMGTLSWDGKIWASLFASTTARSAGYATIDYGSITDASKLLTIMLMFVGGAPGSTAGGIKTITAAVILLYVVSVLSNKQNMVAFRKTVHPATVHKAFMITVISSIMLIGVTLVLTITEQKDFLRLLFEATSAFGTTGLSTNLTPDLSTPGRIIIMLLMFAGRVGPVTLALALMVHAKNKPAIRYPEERLFVG